MAEDLQDEWWEEYRKKSSAEEDEADKNDNQLSKRQKKLKKRKRKIEEVNTTAMSAEDDVKTALLDVAGTVLKEELSNWIESATIRLDVDQTMTNFLEENESKEPLCEVNSPVVIVCGAGKRCTDVLRDIQTWSKEKEGNTAKLFAKHFKIADQIKHLNKGKTSVAVGTPSRIAKLIEDGCLNAKSIVVDFNFRNEKKARLIDDKHIKEQLKELFKIFGDETKRSSVRLLIY
ncbi:Oidioi.mRNA.OKI2018_I69.PAR.g11374.t1.cds [Oikopleura dioica]|uniref:Oidioi.mRNA.OKI2018_I69.PAR.g11374.t1.cds n=1 Tax=Oikopleura dioica TaxID=34765 RepID=A0ABN7RZG3_OIKDI|nr:Oidioi.mRNA.OKI2018_I69.PAR.g11374.t1.cds [Oikopleura dioica]